jgi:hypothetical protein
LLKPLKPALFIAIVVVRYFFHYFASMKRRKESIIHTTFAGDAYIEAKDLFEDKKQLNALITKISSSKGVSAHFRRAKVATKSDFARRKA